MGEEDDTVGGVADMRGLVGSGCERGRRVRRCGRHAGLARGPRACWEDEKGWQAGWAGWLARAEQAEAACEAYILSLPFSILLFISSLLFEFEFGSGI